MMTRRSILSLVAISLCLIVVLAVIWGNSKRNCCDLESLRNELRDRMDVRYPGRGYADYPDNPVSDVPKGYAMVLKAELIAMEHAGASEISLLGRNAAEFLLSHSDERGDGFPGWGVPVAWDAYGDGSVNPADTKYTISSAIVADSLLDWISVDPAAPRQHIIELLGEVFRPYVNPEAWSPSGMLPYSLEEVDKGYDTYNSAAYMAGVMQRYSTVVEEENFRDALRQAADSTVAVHLSNVRKTSNGTWWWTYSMSDTFPNDLAHGSYILHGMRLYADHGGRYRGDIDLEKIEAILGYFATEQNEDHKFSLQEWPSFREDFNRPARSYALGMGLYLACRLMPVSVQDDYIAAIPEYRLADGGYATFPPASELGNLVVGEYEAYVLLGITACLYRANS